MKVFCLIALAMISGTAGAAQASPRTRDGRVLFVASSDVGFGRHANILGVEPATGELTTIAAANVDSVDPAASIDGRKLAFVRGFLEGGPARGLYVSDSRGHHARRIAPFGLSPSWSPNGSHIAYVRDQHVVVMRADGTQRHRLALTNVLRVAWSPRGNRLLVARGFNGCCLQLIRPDGGGLTTLLRLPNGQKVEHPTWSPDARRIAFEYDTSCVGLTCDGGLGTVIATPRGRILQKLDNAFYLTFSPSGKRVAYATGAGVFVRDLDDGTTTQVFKGTLETFGIAWQPR